MPLFVAFLFSIFSSTSQTPCKDLENSMDEVLNSDYQKFYKLTQELQRCEKKNSIGKYNSRYGYQYARYLLKTGQVKLAKRRITEELRTQKNQATYLDLQVLNIFVYVFSKQYDSTLIKSYELLHGNKLSAKQCAKIYQCISQCHGILNNQRYEIDAINKILYYSIKCKDSSFISNAYSNLGTYYFRYQSAINKRKSLFYFNKAMVYASAKDSAFNAVNLMNIGVAYNELKDYNKGLRYYLDVYTKYKNFLRTNDDYANLISNIGAAYLNIGNLDSAALYFKQALTLHKKMEYTSSDNFDIFSNLSALEYRRGNFKLSRDYLGTYLTLKSNYQRRERNNKVIEMQERFNAKDKQAQILRLKNRNQQAKLSYYKLQNGIIVSVVLLGLLITLFFYRQRKKEQALKIVRKNELKRAALEASENEKLRFSRDLHDTLGGSLTLISLLVNQAGDKNPDQVSDFNKLYEIVQGSITDLRRVCRDMYPSEILVSGVINSLKNFYLRLGTIHESFNFNFAADDLKLEKGFSVNMYRILQELTNNTFKYAEATSVEVNIQKDGEELRILFRDNGKGVELNDLLKGVGLNSIEERTKAYKGSVKFNSSSGNGFTAVMRFPLNEIEEKGTV